MKTLIKSNSLALLALAGAIIVLAISFFLSNIHPVYGSNFDPSPIITVATSSSAISVTSSTRILATTTSSNADGSYLRTYTVFCNPNNNPVYINIDGDKPANSNTGAYTYIISAAAGYNACWELTDSQMRNVGSITASSTNQTATVITVKDYVYQ